jgi:uncharacterized protein YdhG (YjbR/CyaY superfamily)
MGTQPDHETAKEASMAQTKKTENRTARSTSGTFTDAEKLAMQERARELKAEKKGLDGEADLRAAIAKMVPADRAMAERIHRIVTQAAPDLESRTWYGMPAWAKDGKTIAFFQPAAKFKARYSTFGFNEDAKLDEGNIWPTSWALTTLTPADEKTISALVKRAVS